jgi:hypothetical protein
MYAEMGVELCLFLLLAIDGSVSSTSRFGLHILGANWTGRFMCLRPGKPAVSFPTELPRLVKESIFLGCI